jgi:hypothetical protein
LFVYLAREAPLGLVLRRGPSAWARLSLWHTDTDTFEHGQWINSRIYQRRSDLSADGSLFVYFARNSGRRRLSDGPERDTWVAISRPPYFTALALWWVGGTYCSGGFFLDRHSVWLGWTDPPDQGRLPRWLRGTAEAPYIDRTNNWTERTVFLNRLLRDGWQLVAEAPRETWEHRHPRQPLMLIMTQASCEFRAYGGPYRLEYTVRPEPGAERIALGQATWADWDQHGRLVLAQQGRLLEWQPATGLRILADFTDQAPEPAPAPDWAIGWPAPPPQ